MFGFKAYFWDDRVRIEDHVYRNNEILTAYLNLSDVWLADDLDELYELRQRVQLMEGGGEDFCDAYNRHVQKAQSLFFEIGNIVKDLPPYHDFRIANKLDTPLLFDCLNKNFFWEDGLDINDESAKPDGFSNEFGFVFRSNNGNNIFYNHYFLPHYRDLESDDPDVVLMLHRTNEEVCKLFDAFITLAQDILRVQTAYAELLNDYIHSKRKFLNDGETAEQFVRYLQAAKSRNSVERVQSSGSMQMSHEVYGGRLCETYVFDSLGAFLYVDFFRGLERNSLPRRCDNCGRYFLLPAGKYSNYCERPLEDDPGKTCRDVGARRRYDDKCKTDPIWLAYNRAYKAHYARYMKKKMTTAQFEQWSRYAVELREQAESGTLEQAEYERLLKI
jgi:hypothetical protein